ncbi:hypothetical protein L249_0142 [Ophiocordyceps polyrhachis-furcata BCC 54312]|uniref:DUF155 domain-containing protein n=1 Tax=Ophiocordyceps polyrhachis-furcata BCC 54312 TaxID=1330021 RepID=A0A367LEP3_9HYPO|nr:hypothetical protein L249_0142 [Ophiocordyceps polyrhachis-furcata BCC 54312]
MSFALQRTVQVNAFRAINASVGCCCRRLSPQPSCPLPPPPPPPLTPTTTTTTTSSATTTSQQRRQRLATSRRLSGRGHSSSPPPSHGGEKDAPSPSPPPNPTTKEAAADSAKRKAPRAKPTKDSLLRRAIVAHLPKDGGDKMASGEQAGGRGADPSTTVSAACVAESFKMSVVLEILTSHGFAIDPHRAGFDSGEVVHARSANGADIFVFSSGTVVTWSLPVDAVCGYLMRAAEAAHEPELCEFEDLEFVVDESKSSSTMKADVIVLGTRRDQTGGNPSGTTLAKVAFSSGLARSTKLAVIENTLTMYIDSMRDIPALLSRGSRVPLGRSFILKKTGELLSLRARLNHYWELTDALPDIFWDLEGLENYYELVGRALDVKVRIHILNQKMDYAQEIAGVLRQMASERHGTRLELIIIILIAVEVIFELRRIVLETMATPDDDKKLPPSSSQE